MQSIFNLPAPLLVFVGGGFGAMLRWLAGRWLAATSGVGAFPWATLLVNLTGSFAMGVLAGWLLRHDALAAENARLALGVGLLGGFTTFSAFSLELLHLVERQQLLAAAGYVLAPVIGGLAAVWLGMMMMRGAAA